MPVVRCRKTSCKCNNKYGMCQAEEITVGSCEFPSECRTEV